jgi:hypothetical protein
MRRRSSDRWEHLSLARGVLVCLLSITIVSILTSCGSGPRSETDLLKARYGDSVSVRFSAPRGATLKVGWNSLTIPCEVTLSAFKAHEITITTEDGTSVYGLLEVITVTPKTRVGNIPVDNITSELVQEVAGGVIMTLEYSLDEQKVVQITLGNRVKGTSASRGASGGPLGEQR